MTESVREERLRALLQGFPGTHILVAGDVMLDEYVWGAVRRISPEAPVPVVEVERRSCAPGGAGNTAANIVGLAGHVSLLGVVGRDHAADRLREALRQRDVTDDHLLTDLARPTTAKMRVIAHSQQVVRVDEEDPRPLSRSVEDALLARAEELLADTDGCILSDYAKGVVSERFAHTFIRLARAAGKPVVVDPKGTNYAKYRGATVVKPNLLEVSQVLNRSVNGQDELLRAGADLMQLLGGAVVITRGAHGLSVFEKGTDPVHIRAEARDVYDVTGAGDTAASTLVMALATGAPLEQAARLANRAAGVVVGKLGTTSVCLDDLLGVEV
jgi:D-beta-D-heptose 7-phosphate kinase/D-beta-D-heptose 1-phosphate adenosyltransferase